LLASHTVLLLVLLLPLLSLPSSILVHLHFGPYRSHPPKDPAAPRAPRGFSFQPDPSDPSSIGSL